MPETKPEFLDPEQYYQRFIKESPYVPGDNGEPCDIDQIPWLNRKLIREGQDFLKRNFFPLFLAHMGGLIFGFSFKTLTSVLLRTGGFGLGDSTISMLRHIETGTHLDKWYGTDILSKDSAGFKDIQLVRKLHMHALRRSQRTPLNLVTDVPGKEEKLQIIEAIKKDLDACCDTSNAPQHVLTYHPELFFSQFDMAMTQFGFFSLVCMFPDRLGIRNKKGLDGFVHLWAVYGRLLGIEDRFNLALYPNPEIHLKLLFNVAIPGLKDMDLTILTLQETYIAAVSRMFGFGSLKPALLFGFENFKSVVPGLTGEHLYALMDWKDKLSVACLKGLIFVVYYLDFVKYAANIALFAWAKFMEWFVIKMYGNVRKAAQKIAVDASAKIDGVPAMAVHKRA